MYTNCSDSAEQHFCSRSLLAIAPQITYSAFERMVLSYGKARTLTVTRGGAISARIQHDSIIGTAIFIKSRQLSVVYYTFVFSCGSLSPTT